MKVKDWNNNEIVAVRSKGGVLATSHPYENLIRTGCTSWPPPEIVQKLYKSRHSEAFADKEKKIVESGLGYYCDLQSIHSEDSITWSIFGTVAHAPVSKLKAWLTEFFKLLNLDNVNTNDPEIYLWRRLPHPDTLVSGGPEIDAGIITANAIILVEAKWRSKVGSKQGKEGKKDQIQLRKEFLSKYGPRIFPNRTEFAVVGVSLFANVFQDTTPSGLLFRTVTWEQLCELGSHPHAKEVVTYFKWKKKYSKVA
jgi:hypothetical protein